jgi:hypothetical protein
MTSKTIIPPSRVPVVGSDGLMTTPWRRYFDEIDVILGSGTNALDSAINIDLFDSTMHHAFYGELSKELKDIRKELAFCDVSPHLSRVESRLKSIELSLLMIKSYDAEIAQLERKIKSLENVEVFSS